MILVDTSALIKLVIEEAESDSLRRYLAEFSAAGQRFVISEIGIVEMRRVGIRHHIDLKRIESVLEQFDVLGLTSSVLQLAGRIPYSALRTLDAIHIAAAVTGRCTNMLTYDIRQSEAAAEEGVPAISPS